jgi:hypothetical protein
MEVKEPITPGFKGSPALYKRKGKKPILQSTGTPKSEVRCKQDKKTAHE